MWPIARKSGHRVEVLLLAGTLGLLGAVHGSAGGGPENVALVVNADSWASLTVANEFVYLRQIPPGNVIYLTGGADFEQVDVETFRQRILKPALDAVAQRGLREQIDYLVYSCDLPFAIDVSKDLAGRKVPQVITPTASLNGLTYLYADVLNKDVSYLRLDVNRYMRRPLPLRTSPPLSDEEQRQYAQAEELYNQKKYAEAVHVYAELARKHAGDPNLLYNYACCLALAGQPDEAVAALQDAFAAGWRNHRHTAGDEDLKPLRERPDFRKLLEEMRSAVIAVQPTHGFRSAYGWDEQGGSAEAVNNAAPDAQHYLLSTVLGVTSGRGNSVREVLAGLRRSAGADGTRPKGTVYFLQNGDVRSTTREWAFESAAARLQELGVAARIEAGVLPQSKSDVCGAVIGSAGFDWKGCGSSILPGAICEHLTSTGAVLQETGGQTPCTELIRCGAAGTAGTVTEPYALQEKFPNAFLHVHYARGCSLAEAFYQSVQGPYQLLILGDPLCQPWARRPEVTLTGLTAGAKVKGRVELRPGATDAGPTPVSRCELFLDGARAGSGLSPGVVKPGQAATLDTTALADGYHELAVVGIGADEIETQGRLMVAFSVDNHGRQIAVTPARPENIVWGQPIKLRATASGAGKISFLHNGRAVATASGADGQVEIDPRQLGLGPVRLFAVAGDKAPFEVRSPPVEFTVQPPASIQAIRRRPSARLEDGLELKSGSHEPVVVPDTQAADWLAKAGVEADPDFALTGYFEVPEDDLYQIQVRANVAPLIDVSGTKLDLPAGDNWRYLPVVLAHGTHVLRVHGHAPADARLDLRLGAAGTYRLSGQRYKHIAH